jgi:hypothetical protein
LIVQEFDDIHNKEITKRYDKDEIRRLSKRKTRERSIGAAGDISNWMLNIDFSCF